MKSIRIKFVLFSLILLLANLTLSFNAYRALIDLRTKRAQLDHSYRILEHIQEPAILEPQSGLKQDIVDLTPLVEPQSRRQTLQKWLQLSEHPNTTVYKAHLTTVKSNELEFQRFTRHELDYLEQQALYFGGLALLTMAIGLTFFVVYLNRGVVDPLKGLEKKMLDFIQDQYTYKFSAPKADEIGQMHSTFNNLAQRVLSNMEQLRTLDQAKSDFLSIASHELRTPLTSIKGSLGLLRSGMAGKMNEMADNLLNIADVETDRLIRLINDILDLAKIEAGKFPLQTRWTSLYQITQTTISSLEGLASQAHVKLQSEIISQAEIQADHDRIQQVLTNLLSNAIKFSPADTTVTVGMVVNEQNQLVIEVRDQGRGISPEDQEMLFQKFRQVTNAKNPLVKGTGLGLAIAKAIVEEHGGQIGVRSTPGTGSTFFFTLVDWRLNQNREAVA